MAPMDGWDVMPDMESTTTSATSAPALTVRKERTIHGYRSSKTKNGILYQKLYEEMVLFNCLKIYLPSRVKPDRDELWFLGSF